MSYQVIARRFRPQQFDQIVGQESLVSALKHSLEAARVGHAYLFCGPRGVGKTTVARILAKALNCAKGPTVTPCDKCQNCLEITQGNALDVLEIDGASNRGIDEIRNLRENVKYMAASSPHKIYIIDEVHMLTTEAFNALLKTLEEPPAHVKFLFATTDPQKLPATILSRCQKFELKRIPHALMGERLNALAKKEKVKMTPDALLAVMQQAQGSMRDAESLLEVLIAGGEKELDYACVREILGLSDEAVFYSATDALFRADGKAVLNLVAEIFTEGKEPGRFLSGFCSHLRNLLLAKVLGENNEALEMPAEQIQRLVAQAKPLAEESLIALLEMATRAEQQMRTAVNTRIVLELFFMKAVEYLQRPSLTELLARLEQMEARLEGSPAASATAGRSAAPVSTTRQAVVVPTTPPGPSQVSLYEDEPSGDGDGTDIKTAWALAAQSLGSTNPVLRTCMLDATPVTLTDDNLLVRLKPGANFSKTTLEDKTCQALIEQRLRERLGRNVRIKMESGAAVRDVRDATQKVLPAVKDSSQNPALLEAMSILKGKIIKTT